MGSVNGYRRLQYAAERDGTWKVSGRDYPGRMMNKQEFISDQYDLLVEITFCGYTVKAAKLWDFSDKIVTNAEDGVPSQELTAADGDKAGRIEDVLLGNSRRF